MGAIYLIKFTNEMHYIKNAIERAGNDKFRIEYQQKYLNNINAKVNIQVNDIFSRLDEFDSSLKRSKTCACVIL